MPAVRNDGPRVYVRRAAGTAQLCPTALARRAVQATIMRASPHVRGDVTVVVTNDRAIRGLNRRYRGIDRATDVLSFDIGDGRTVGEPFGDVVISVETARRQAREYGAPLKAELLRLLVHGALHLCGYDHREQREAARMHGLTRKLVSELLSA